MHVPVFDLCLAFTIQLALHAAPIGTAVGTFDDPVDGFGLMQWHIDIHTKSQLQSKNNGSSHLAPLQGESNTTALGSSSEKFRDLAKMWHVVHRAFETAAHTNFSDLFRRKRKAEPLRYAKMSQASGNAWKASRIDVFPNASAPLTGDEGLNFFESAPWQEWIILGCACTAFCVLDAVAIQQLPESFWWHFLALTFWIAVAVLYVLGIAARTATSCAMDWTTGYLLEWILSLDNLFVFHLIFETYKTPANHIHKAVFVGIIGAVLMRMIFFIVLSTLLHLFDWVRFVFGLMLIWSGIEAARKVDDDMDVEDTLLVRSLRYMCGNRIRKDYDLEERRLVSWDEQGRLQITMLLVVIICLEVTDVLFAIDSVSAKVAQVPNQYLAFSSSVIAMFGLRAMFLRSRPCAHV